VAVARDKALTARVLAAAGVPTPRTLSLAAYRENPETIPGPVIAKPVGGSSSVGLARGRGPADFAALPAEGYLVQALWEGAEYTVNVFVDRQGALRCAVPHRRLEVRAGEVSKGRTERVPALEEAAKKIVAALPGAQGPLCFQAIVRESGECAVFEINARFGGGYPLAHQAGAQFSKWLLEETVGLPCTAHNDWKEGVTMLRYDAAVFLHD
jgi:carbamoyl-phosphate synthase large subunit